ncbi:MAG TPA: bifunctional YncE family protein/alkaline phosphatase family protein [Tepidisphaeraceae bacterium]|jgi:YVTN family beta-propeller protein
MRFVLFSWLLLAASGAARSADAAEGERLFNGWKLTPAGEHVRVEDMPLKMVLSPDGRFVLAVCGGHTTGVAVVEVSTRKAVQFMPLRHCWNGIAFAADGKKLFVSGGNSNSLHVLGWDGGRLSPLKSLDLDPENKPKRGEANENFFSSIAVNPRTGKLYVCNEGVGEVWAVDPESGKVEKKLRTGEHPHTCLFTRDGKFLFVSNWGSRNVSIIDPRRNGGKQVAMVPVGIRPNDMAVSSDGRVFVACAGDNTVHVINAAAPEVNELTDEATPPPQQASEIISTSLYPDSPEGSTPSGVAVSPDGKALFVANADNNDVAVVDISNPEVSTVVGFVPTGWYPTAVVTDGKSLLVATGKGLGNFGPSPSTRGSEPRTLLGTRYNHPTGLIEGHVSIVKEPTGAELAAYTRQVRDNSPYTPATLREAASRPPDCIIPAKVGEACAIKYVLYIIKENRTYDQVLGDMTDRNGKRIGNGDPNLTLFGQTITPNQHELARSYVLFDNLYCNSEVSYDGHSWCDGAIATDYRQRAWTLMYSGHGTLPGNRDMSVPSSGFLWDLCKRHGVSFRNYGEGVAHVPANNRGKWAGRRDYERVENWINDLRAAEKGGELPRFTIMQLGENHTAGTTPGAFTPAACVASNDLAVGKIVEAAVASKFWKEMAIFIIEDDAQNGPDHVDAHRTVGLVISPYIKRGMIDSTPYTTTSMIRTMELILGLPPLTQYDAAATPMFKCFGNQAVITPYKALRPQVNLAAVNKPDAPGAKASAAMDFDEYDEAPEDELNRILWAAMKGEDAVYPVPIHRAVFVR